MSKVSAFVYLCFRIRACRHQKDRQLENQKLEKMKKKSQKHEKQTRK
jgi:hypothetical protein